MTKMMIHEAKEKLESEDYSNEDLLILLEYYSESKNDSWRKPEERESSRIYLLALKSMILDRMNK